MFVRALYFLNILEAHISVFKKNLAKDPYRSPIFKFTFQEPYRRSAWIRPSALIPITEAHASVETILFS